MSNSIKINLPKGGPLGGRGWNMIFSEILESLIEFILKGKIVTPTDITGWKSIVFVQ